MIYLTNINLNQNELQNAVLQPLATAPSSAKLGQVYYNSTDKCLYQYDGSAWKRVGVIYEETSAAGKVLSGLAADGTVYTAQVKDLQLKGITPISGGYVADGDSLSTAILALDQAVQNAVAGGGEVNQFAFSNVKVGSVTISATGKTDTVEFVAGSNVTLTPNASGKTITVSVTVPTRLSELANDKNFIDSTVSNLTNYYLKAETYTQSEVNNLIGQIKTIQIVVVDNLPTTGESNKIYLVPKSGSESNNSYYEYIWVSNTSKFEKIGDTEIDLSNYLQKNGDGSNLTTTFTAASTRELPISGETIAVIIGKVIKYLTDLKTVAFTGSYNDLTDKPTQVVKYTSGTLASGSTTITISFTGTFIGYTAIDAVTNEVILVDSEVGTNQAVFTISATHSNNITIIVMYS